MDWSAHGFADFLYYWDMFVEWYLVQPLFAQILVIIGIFAVVALTIVILYYVIKGVAYLVYYILKGIYYLFKGIGLLFYKLFKGLYDLISGKNNISTNKSTVYIRTKTPKSQNYTVNAPIKIGNSLEVRFCSECGVRFSEKVSYLLKSRGIAFCQKCGKKYHSDYMRVEA